MTYHDRISINLTSESLPREFFETISISCTKMETKSLKQPKKNVFLRNVDTFNMNKCVEKTRTNFLCICNSLIPQENYEIEFFTEKANFLPKTVFLDNFISTSIIKKFVTYLN